MIYNSYFLVCKKGGIALIKVSDYVFKYLETIGVNTTFTLTGGGIMHLVDSLGRSNMEYEISFVQYKGRW